MADGVYKVNNKTGRVDPFREGWGGFGLSVSAPALIR